MEQDLDARQRALLSLGEALRIGGYRFVTPTPETIRRVNARVTNAEARTLRDVFGWSRALQARAVAGEAGPSGANALRARQPINRSDHKHLKRLMFRCSSE